MANPHRDKAVTLLQHYFRMIGEAAGLKWNPDLDMEVEQMVDEIIEAASQAPTAAPKPPKPARTLKQK